MEKGKHAGKTPTSRSGTTDEVTTSKDTYEVTEMGTDRGSVNCNGPKCWAEEVLTCEMVYMVDGTKAAPVVDGNEWRTGRKFDLRKKDTASRPINLPWGVRKRHIIINIPQKIGLIRRRRSVQGRSWERGISCITSRIYILPRLST